MATGRGPVSRAAVGFSAALAALSTSPADEAASVSARPKFGRICKRALTDARTRMRSSGFSGFKAAWMTSSAEIALSFFVINIISRPTSRLVDETSGAVDAPKYTPKELYSQQIWVENNTIYPILVAVSLHYPVPPILDGFQGR